MHGLDCPYQFLWVSRGMHISVVGQQLLKCWSTTSEHCSAELRWFRKHIAILLSLFPKSKNQNFQKRSYSRTTNLPAIAVQQDKLNRAQRHNIVNKNAWDITRGAVLNCCTPKLKLMPSSRVCICSITRHRNTKSGTVWAHCSQRACACDRASPFT